MKEEKWEIKGRKNSEECKYRCGKSDYICLMGGKVYPFPGCSKENCHIALDDK